jgi:phage repressor protein C with HTH and peptisase S24 domain
MEDITRRFINVYKHLVAEKKINSGKEFAKKVGISPSLLTEITKGRNEVGLKTIQNTVHCFKEINLSWLFDGIGDMITATASKLTASIPNNEVLVPVYNHVASAGRVQLFKDFSHSQAEGYISVPHMPKCDGAVPIVGDSMYPLLKAGDLVCYAIKTIDNIIFGEMYLIDWTDANGDDMFMAKFIAKGSSKDMLKLVSHNKHHDDFEIKLNSIRQLALIKLSVRFNTH